MPQLMHSAVHHQWQVFAVTADQIAACSTVVFKKAVITLDTVRIIPNCRSTTLVWVSLEGILHTHTHQQQHSPNTPHLTGICTLNPRNFWIVDPSSHCTKPCRACSRRSLSWRR
jgi:hypothetical protein